MKQSIRIYHSCHVGPIVSTACYLAIIPVYLYFQSELFFRILFCQMRRTDHKNGTPSEARKPRLVFDKIVEGKIPSLIAYSSLAKESEPKLKAPQINTIHVYFPFTQFCSFFKIFILIKQTH